jgi:translation elongation factor EF-G
MPTLGVPGYTFEDLHDPDRLQSLYERFCEEVRAVDPVFWSEWDAYRQNPEAPRPPIVLSNLLVGLAPFVSRFLRRLFDVDAPADALSEETRAQDDLFRFKVDFVRRLALPLVKGGAHIASTPEDEAIVERMIALHGNVDRELAVARAGCAILDREKSDAQSTKPQLPGPKTE